MASSAIIPLNRRSYEIPETANDAEDNATSGRGIPIRAISRAISVLQAINRAGSLNMMEISQASRVPYPTACRIVQTLLHEGLLEREEGRKHYRPTALVQTLSHGFQAHGELVRTVRPHIAQLTHEIGWPISLSTHVGSNMVLRDSTHSLTSLTYNDYHPGYTMPLLDCAAGLVHLAFCPAEERDTILDNLDRFGDDETHNLLQLLREGGLIDTVHSSGYAARGYNRFTLNPGKTSSIAVPLLVGRQIKGCLSVAFFATTIDMRDAIRELLPKLRTCAQTIGKELAGTNLEA
ncbi:helix-turn-helix domain-containing protein [Novosphingobium sp. KN65.2]|uniref:helix-turn-helix domain-containing protein n=1 Tax=Novosphingobium sp. KN65.2 TaxID=1478134 RepID=UPI0005DEF9BB|nr:helix-turn-helix domain-containing protein [Novosphingobium sp. KN65.2]CDO38041.1 putative Transcriptional regulator, TrmB [Novosphingobium sp. KN65.2]